MGVSKGKGESDGERLVRLPFPMLRKRLLGIHHTESFVVSLGGASALDAGDLRMAGVARVVSLRCTVSVEWRVDTAVVFAYFGDC